MFQEMLPSTIALQPQYFPTIAVRSGTRQQFR
jgi:hypothetical protein